jgi:hypothetical protein
MYELCGKIVSKLLVDGVDKQLQIVVQSLRFDRGRSTEG